MHGSAVQPRPAEPLRRLGHGGRAVHERVGRRQDRDVRQHLDVRRVPVRVDLEGRLAVDPAPDPGRHGHTTR